MTMTQQTAAQPAPGASPRLSKDGEQIKQALVDAQQAVDAAAQAQNKAGRRIIVGRDGHGGFGILAPPAPPGVLAPAIPPAPGGTIQSANVHPGMPPEVVDISLAFFLMCAVMVIGWPIAKAFGKRLEHRAIAPSGSPDMADQLQRIEQAVDAMSIEIERISESQRFMAKLQHAQSADPIALPADRR